MTRTTTLACLALLAAAGCTPNATSSFDGLQPASTAATVPTPKRAVRVATVRGASNKAGRALREGLEEALRRRGYDVVRGTRSEAIRLDGRFAPLSEGNATTVTFEWTATGTAGTLGTVGGFERASGGSSDPWRAVDAATVARISERAAQRLERVLERTGG